MPKCASTWLQKYFFIPAHGFHKCLGPFGAHTLFMAPPPFCFEPPVDLFLLNEDDLVPLVSSEGLVGRPLTGGDDAEMILSRLHRTIPDARILIVIREQRSMLRSLYNLLVNWGSPYSIDILLKNPSPVNIPRFDPGFLCFDRNIHAYQNSFGSDNVLVLPLENFSTDAPAFLNRISRFCQIDLQRYAIAADTKIKENTSRSLLSLECKRFYNRFILKSQFNQNGFHRPKKVTKVANYDFHLPPRFTRRHEQRFGERIESLIGDYYVESNQRTQELTGLDLSPLGYRLS